MLLTPSDVVAGRVREVRRKRGLTVSQLAQGCAELGVPQLTEQALYNLEAGRADKQGRRRRAVTVDELLVLAHALHCAPVHLLVPLEDDQDYPVTPAVAELAWVARNWVRGEYPVTGTDQRLYFSEVPEREWGLFTPLNLGTYEEQLEALERRRQMLERWHAAQQEGSDG
jgi:transcriptional regulator with XRE-family HTH domain